MSTENKINKHCDNCKYSYTAINFQDEPMGQYCKNVYYNHPDYDVMEDWGKGYCKFHEFKEEL